MAGRLGCFYPTRFLPYNGIIVTKYSPRDRRLTIWILFPDARWDAVCEDSGKNVLSCPGQVYMLLA